MQLGDNYEQEVEIHLNMTLIWCHQHMACQQKISSVQCSQ